MKLERAAFIASVVAIVLGLFAGALHRFAEHQATTIAPLRTRLTQGLPRLARTLFWLLVVGGIVTLLFALAAYAFASLLDDGSNDNPKKHPPDDHNSPTSSVRVPPVPVPVPTKSAPEPAPKAVCDEMSRHAPPDYPNCASYLYLETNGSCTIPPEVFALSANGPGAEIRAFCGALEIKWGSAGKGAPRTF